MGRRTAVLVVVALAASVLFAQPGSAERARVEPHDGGFARAEAKARKDGNVRALVVLNSDFRPEGGMSAKARGRQRAEIAQRQRGVRSDLKGTTYRELHAFETVPYLSLSLSRKAVDRLEASEHVASITVDEPRYRPTLAQSVPLVEADDMLTAGFEGAGKTVAVLDTGVDKTHPFLSGRVVDEACYSGAGFANQSVCPNGQPSMIGDGAGVPCPQNGCGHGTHVAGIAAGAGTTSDGVARGANIMSVQVFSEDGFAYRSDIVKGLERVYAVRTTHAIASVNMSLGGGLYSSFCDGGLEKPAIDNLLSAGIPTAIATGNDGRTDAVSSPSCISSAVAVGSSTKSDTISSFTNNHPTLTDVLAPGSSIRSSVPGGGFESWNGTSMATPHVAGAYALLRQAHPTATVAEMLSALQSTGVAVPDAGYTRPRIRIAPASAAITGGGGGSGDPATHSVTFTIKGRGRGYISADGIDCSRPKRFGDDCFEAYAEGSEVTFFARHYRGSRFVKWTGDFAPCGRSRGCTIVAIDTSYVVKARFRRA